MLLIGIVYKNEIIEFCNKMVLIIKNDLEFYTYCIIINFNIENCSLFASLCQQKKWGGVGLVPTNNKNQRTNFI